MTERLMHSLMKSLISYGKALRQLKVGSVVQVHKVTHTRKDKKSCISDYYVDPIGWLIKEKCIFLARQNQLELEICTSRLGHAYLKAPHSSFQINLKNLIEKKPRK